VAGERVRAARRGGRVGRPPERSEARSEGGKRSPARREEAEGAEGGPWGFNEPI